MPELIRILNGLYEPVELLRNQDGQPVYMFRRIGSVEELINDEQ